MEHVLHTVAGLSPEAIKDVVEQVEHTGHAIVSRLTPEKAETLQAPLQAAGAEAEIEPLKTHNWPLPYDDLTNPLAINLTALNTFILICSSVTMVLALSAIQDGRQQGAVLSSGVTVLIGSCFLSIQVYEYYQLMELATIIRRASAPPAHFRPSVSLFASCFFTMTGFHGAHVTGGVILLLCIFIRVDARRVLGDQLCPRRAGRVCTGTSSTSCGSSCSRSST